MESHLFAKKSFPDKEKIDNIILTSPSPFILQTTTKDNIPEIFVGRTDEMKAIIETIKNVVENKSCVALYIEGAGGSGKSTLYGHIFRAIKQKKYDLLNLSDEYKLDAVFIDSPEDPESCNMLYIYNQIMQNLGKSSFFDELAFFTLKKLLEIIDIRQKALNPLKNINNHQEYLKLANNEEIYEKSINLVKQYYKIIKLEENFNVEWRFLEKLLSLLNPNFDISNSAINELNGTDIGKDKFIKNKTDASEVFNIVSNLIGWIYGYKKVGIVIGIDNIESLTGDKKLEKFENFINMLLDFRNKITRTLLIIIGTSSTWMNFIGYLKNSDYYNQFLGLFSSNNISLKFLELPQVNQVIKKHLDKLYNDHSLTSPIDYPLYPFGSTAIEYLYKISGKNLRNMIVSLNDLWMEFQKSKKVKFISDAFSIMERFKKDITLDDYETEILYQKLWSEKIKTSGKRSTLVEEAIKKAFQILQSESHYQIYKVENNQQIKIQEKKKVKIVRPDVIVSLASPLNIGEMKNIEFQVKIYEKNSSVLKSHIETSKELLEQKKIDFVYFITTTDFSNSLISELREKYPDRVGGVNPLTQEQQAHLSLLVFYEDIFHKELDPSYVKLLLKNSLGIEIGEFFDLIRSLPKISITPIVQPSLDLFGKQTPTEGALIVRKKEPKIEPFVKPPEIKPPGVEVEKEYPSPTEEILLFMYNRQGRFEKQATSDFLKGKIPNFRDEEVKTAFKWLKTSSKFTDNIAKTSIKLNENGIILLKKLNKIQNPNN